MIKLQTPVEIGKSKFGISLKDRILICGSCFADNVGGKIKAAGFNVCANPFGTLYNPVSVCNSFARLRSGSLFGEDDIVQMGSGSELFCSFSHHTSFARESRTDFLENANRKLSESADFYRQCNTIIITLGTSWCFKHIPDGEIVSNCLKRNANEFERVFIESDMTFGLLRRLVEEGASSMEYPKKFIFTVSPIRHMKDGAHGNQISKASLLLAIEKLCRLYPESCEYFPAYEIVLDELRDYRFYAEDMVHPSELAVKYIWEKFCDFAVSETDRLAIASNERIFRQSLHIQKKF